MLLLAYQTWIESASHFGGRPLKACFQEARGVFSSRCGALIFVLGDNPLIDDLFHRPQQILAFGQIGTVTEWAFGSKIDHIRAKMFGDDKAYQL